MSLRVGIDDSSNFEEPSSEEDFQDQEEVTKIPENREDTLTTANTNEDPSDQEEQQELQGETPPDYPGNPASTAALSTPPGARLVSRGV